MTIEAKLDRILLYAEKLEKRIAEITSEMEELRQDFKKEMIIREETVSLDEAARLIGVSYDQCYRYIQSGKLNAFQSGDKAPYKIPMTAIKEFEGRKRLPKGSYHN